MIETLSRRHLLVALGAGAATSVLLPDEALASMTIAVPLPDLTARSHRIVYGTPRELYSRWEDVGGTRRIVTYTRVGVDEPILDDEDAEPEVMVQTLGGRVGDVGQLVHGEPVLAKDETAMLFLHKLEPGIKRITARAQGHYPLRKDRGKQVLRKSPRLGDLVKVRGKRGPSAVEMLTSRSRAEATRLVREALEARNK